MATPIPKIIENLTDHITIIHNNKLIIYNTPKNLHKQTNNTNTLKQILKKIINPQTLKHLNHYFKKNHK